MKQYKELLQSCKRRGVKFEDAEFPPGVASVYIEPGRITKGATFNIADWKRPQDLMEGVTLYKQNGNSSSADPDDLKQGEIGDCWFISSMSIVATRGMPTWESIFVDHDAKVGIYAVRFQGREAPDGTPKTVIVDDRFPMRWDNLIFCHAREKQEIWPAVLEKAYAKLHGSYEAIVGGRVDDGVADLVGGVQSHIDMGDLGPAASDGTLWHKITSNIRAGYLMGAGTNSGSDTNVVEGIVQGHAYALLGAEEVAHDGQTMQLLKLRNPWGCTEWEGEWSDAWINANAPERIKRKLGWKVEDDGMFWMKLPDFLLNFSNLYIVRNFNTSWKACGPFKDKWEGASAAGCSNFRNLGSNPQFHVKVSRPCHVIFQLSQLTDGSRDYTNIAMQLQNLKGRRATRGIREVMSSGSFTNLRTVTMESERLEPSSSGKPYTLVLSTFAPGPFYDDGDVKNERGWVLSVYCDDPEPDSFEVTPLL